MTCRRLRQRKLESDRRPAAWTSALGPKGPTVFVDDVLGDRQPEPQSLRIVGVRSTERLEDVR